MNRVSTFLLCFFSFTSLVYGQQGVLVTLKLTKVNNAPANVPVKVEFPSSCGTCSVVDDHTYARQNVREVILAIRIPVSKSILLNVTTDTAAFRRVTLETVDLSFTKDAQHLRFTVPSQVADRVNSGEFQTHLYWPGVELRLEHGDPSRRAGDYAAGSFPVVERKAATNLEFGLLEAIRQLGLDHYVDDQNLGRLFLMGFDTNYPHGHKDSPPHFHLALWLPNYRGVGSLIPHLYLNPQGLITYSVVTPYDVPIKAAEYKANETFTSIDMLGRPVYSLTITPEGWVDLGRFDGARCSLRPAGKGFDSGVRVSCPEFSPSTIEVEDNIDVGEIHESIDGKIRHVFHYDSDTGALK